MNFKNKEEIFNEGCDVFIREAIEKTQKHSNNFALYAFPKQENLETLIKDLVDTLTEIRHYERLKKKVT